MRILLVTEFMPEGNTHMSGGVESQSYFFCRHMSKLGHDVTVISRKKTWVEASLGSIVSRLWFQVSAIVQGFDKKADIVIGSNYVCYLPAYVIARLEGAKAIAQYHDVFGKDWFEYMSFPLALAGYAMEWIGWKLHWDMIIAVSQTTKERLVKVGVNQDLISVIHNGIDSKRLAQIKVKKYKQPTICVISRLVKYKRVDDVVRAFARVLKKIDDCRLVVIGSGPEFSNLQMLASILDVGDRVSFLGELDDYFEVMAILKQSHVSCLASGKEGFGLVTIESMACGVPFMNSDIQATREVTNNGKGGILYPLGDIEALSDNMIKLLADSKLRDKKVKEGKKLVNNYSWEHIAMETSQVYKQAIIQS